MDRIQAIGFDLFNTLITVENGAVAEAVDRLTQSLQERGLPLRPESFKRAHLEAAMRFLKETRRDGKETHNRYWISAALKAEGHHVLPEDDRIAAAVEDYFSAFLDYAQLVPGTTEMLNTVKERYRLGLLSNFTHPPAAMRLMDFLGLTTFFDVVLISGELGYRKPHPFVFQRLVEDLGVETHRVLFVGDDPEPDIIGATSAGLQPVWTTYVRDQDIAFAPGDPTPRADDPDDEVPRISGWEDLFALLGMT
jgi:putative hydrolase of the HAD superfamily